MEKIVAPINLRSARDMDVPFIFSSWLRSYRETRAAKVVDNWRYFPGQHKTIEGILTRGAKILVATSTDDDSQILGYVIYEGSKETLTIHWLYVKLPFRNFSIGRNLMSAVFESVGGKPEKYQVSHLPKMEKKIFEKMEIIYNPYAAWYANE